MTADVSPEAIIAEHLGAFRPCGHGEAVAYRAHLEVSGPEAVQRLIDVMERRGIVSKPGKAHHWATLDLLAADGMDILDERAILDADAWRECVELLDLRADSSDCAVCEPNAHAATYGRVA